MKLRTSHHHKHTHFQRKLFLKHFRLLSTVNLHFTMPLPSPCTYHIYISKTFPAQYHSQTHCAQGHHTLPLTNPACDTWNFAACTGVVLLVMKQLCKLSWETAQLLGLNNAVCFFLCLFWLMGVINNWSSSNYASPATENSLSCANLIRITWWTLTSWFEVTISSRSNTSCRKICVVVLGETEAL